MRPRKEIKQDPERYYVSFDLGLRGNYLDLYMWLDNLDAKECGDTVATFLSTKTREELIEELSNLLKGEKARVYILHVERGKGSFVIGKRKKAPWTGYAELESEDEEEV